MGPHESTVDPLETLSIPDSSASNQVPSSSGKLPLYSRVATDSTTDKRSEPSVGPSQQKISLVEQTLTRDQKVRMLSIIRHKMLHQNPERDHSAHIPPTTGEGGKPPETGVNDGVGTKVDESRFWTRPETEAPLGAPCTNYPRQRTKARADAYASGGGRAPAGLGVAIEIASHGPSPSVEAVAPGPRPCAANSPGERKR